MGPSFEVASVGEDVATGNHTPSKVVVAWEYQATKIEVTLPGLQSPSKHFQDHAFTDACRQSEEREYTVQNVHMDTCKHLPNIHPQISNSVRSASWLYALMDKADNKIVTYLTPLDTSAFEPSQVPTARCNYIAESADAPSGHDTITIIAAPSLVGNDWLYWWLSSGFIMVASHQCDNSDPRIQQ